MASSRQDRMGQRLRGAQRHQVAEDISFGFVLPVPGEDAGEPPALPQLPEAALEPAPTLEPASVRITPNTSAKRKRLDEGSSASPAANQMPPPRQPPKSSPTRSLSSRRSPDTLPDPGIPPAPSTPVAAETAARVTGDVDRGLPSTLEVETAASVEEATAKSKSPTQLIVEVAESPLEAPGSGRRRDVLISSASLPSRILQDVLQSTNDDEDGPYSSSPSLRMAQRHALSSSRRGPRRSPRLAFEVSGGDLEGLSAGKLLESEETEEPEPTVQQATTNDQTEEIPESAAQSEEEDGAEQGTVDPAQEGDDSQVVQEEAVQDAEPSKRVEEQSAARRPRTKRRRQGSPAHSSILGHEDNANDEPAPKRRRSSRGSPSSRDQNKPKPKARPKPKEKPAAKSKNPRTKRARSEALNQDANAEDDDLPVAITVQRFTRKARALAAADEENDPLTAMDIPFTSRSGVNTVDVLWQLCHDTIDSSRDALKEAQRDAVGKSKKKEYQIQNLALLAFREELEKRFLEHTILLDNLHTLTKRVRKAHKERDVLRDEVLQMRAEREEVYETIESIRTQHEAESKDALRRLDLSSAINEVEIAVERGKTAPEPSAGEMKVANLANLEVQVARLTGQVCSRSAEGGALNQIRRFNAFLERAAVALESK